jgi:hypothetical protein
MASASSSATSVDTSIVKAAVAWPSISLMTLGDCFAALQHRSCAVLRPWELIGGSAAAR